MFDKLSARCVGLVGKLLSVKIGDSLVGLHLNVKKWSAKIDKGIKFSQITFSCH